MNSTGGLSTLGPATAASGPAATLGTRGQAGLLALGTVLPQALALVGVGYAPLLMLGLAPNPLWCLWSALVGGLLMWAATRQGHAIYGVRPGGALLYGSTLGVCAALAPELKLGPLGTMGLAAACMTLAGVAIWLAVRSGLTTFARYLPAPVARGLSLGIGLTILWIQLRTVAEWLGADRGQLKLDLASLATVGLLALMIRLALLWRRDHSRKPYLLALLPVAVACVWVLERGTSISFAWVAAPEVRGLRDLLPPWVGSALAGELVRPDRWSQWWTTLTVLGAQSLFVAFTFIVDSAGTAANLEQATGEPHDLNGELRASALSMAVLPWFGLMPASSNMAPTRPLLEGGRRSLQATRGANGVVAAGLAVMLVFAWLGLNRVPALFVVAALVVIALNLIDPVQLQRPDAEPGERQMWWQSWIIGLVFLFTSGVFAMLAGFVVAVAQFVRGAENSVVRSVYTLRELRSRRWRGKDEEVALRRSAGRVAVVVLQGNASFAVARRIREEVRRAVREQPLDALLIDAQRVNHWDVTALDSFKRMAAELAHTEIELLLAHPSEEARVALAENARLFRTTDRALEWAENEVLRRQGLAAALENPPVPSVQALSLCEGLSEAGRLALPGFGQVVTVAPGQQVFDQGDRDARLMALLAGAVTIEVPGRAEPLRLATFSAGMVFGELAFLDGSARSARAVAVEPCRIFCLARHDFARWAKEHPRDAQTLLNTLAAQMALRLRFTTAQLIAFNP